MKTRRDTGMKRHPSPEARSSSKKLKTFQPKRRLKIVNEEIVSDATDSDLEFDLLDNDIDYSKYAVYIGGSDLKDDSDIENKATTSHNGKNNEGKAKGQGEAQIQGKDQVEGKDQASTKKGKVEALVRNKERQVETKQLADSTADQEAGGRGRQATQAHRVPVDTGSREAELLKLTQALQQQLQAQQQQKAPAHQQAREDNTVTYEVDQGFSVSFGPQHVTGTSPFTYQGMTFNKTFNSGKSYSVSTKQKHVVPLIQQLVPHASKKYPGKTNRFLLKFTKDTLLPHFKEVFVDSPERRMPQDVKDHLIKINEQLSTIIEHVQQEEELNVNREAEKVFERLHTPAKVQWTRNDGMTGISGLLEALQQSHQ